MRLTEDIKKSLLEELAQTKQLTEDDVSEIALKSDITFDEALMQLAGIGQPLTESAAELAEQDFVTLDELEEALAKAHEYAIAHS